MISNIFVFLSVILLVLSAIFGTLESTVIFSFIMLLCMYAMIWEHNKFEKKYFFKKSYKCYHTKTDCDECMSQTNCTHKKTNVLIER